MTNDSADPRHYFRLLLQRLLETQLCIKTLPPAAANTSLRAQEQTNAYTLSEIKSWLEEAGDNWEIAPSSSFVSRAEMLGVESHFPTLTGTPWDVLARFAPMEQAPGSPPAPSSPPSGPTLPPLARSPSGRITFQHQSSSTRPQGT